jgi:hypothetical protein
MHLQILPPFTKRKICLSYLKEYAFGLYPEPYASNICHHSYFCQSPVEYCHLIYAMSLKPALVFTSFQIFILFCVFDFYVFWGITVNLGCLGVDRIRMCKRLNTLDINYLYCLTYIMQCNKERKLVKYKCYKWLKIIGIAKKN